MVDTVQKVASPRHAGLAREEVVLLVGGVPQTLEVVRQDVINGGQQAYWLCPRCGALRYHLYVVDSALACRVCHRLDYRSRHVPRAVARAAKLRRALNAPPSLLNGLPPRPHNVWAAARYDRLARELVTVERVLGKMLSGTVRALERRKGRLHGPR